MDNLTQQTNGIIWITGASSGIGRALTLQFLQTGRIVAGSSNNESGLAQLADEAEKLPGRFVAFPLDVRKASQALETVKAIQADLGRIGLAILCAGIYRQVDGRNFDPKAFSEVADVNLFGVINCMAAVLPAMREERKGQIAIVASLAGYIGQRNYIAYGMSKAALINMAQALRADLAELGIKLQLVTPGFVQTPLTATDPARMQHTMSADEAARRICVGLAKNQFEISFPRRMSWIVRLMRAMPLTWAQAINDGARKRTVTPAARPTNPKKI